MDWYESKERVECGFMEMRKLTREELHEILASHRLWISTDGRRGSRADLENAYLRNHMLKGECLKAAKLSWASISDNDLSGVDLSHADLSCAYLQRANLTNANLAEANLTAARFDHARLIAANLRGARAEDTVFLSANLEHAILNEANLAGAKLSEARVYGVAAWDVESHRYSVWRGMFANPAGFALPIKVYNLSAAHFVYSLYQVQPIEQLLNAATYRSVFILGRFEDGGIDTLDKIAVALQMEDYIPIVYSFQRPLAHDHTDTVRTLAGMARFIIADLSGPSVPHELMAIVPHIEVPTVRIIEMGRKSYSLSRDLERYPWMVGQIVTFGSQDEDLSRVVRDEVIPAAESKCAELLERLRDYD